MIICLSKHNKHGKVSVIGYVLFVHFYFNSTTMKKDIGIPGLMAVVAVLYLLGQIASCHETNKATEATITTDGMGQIVPALDSFNLKLDRLKIELLKMGSLNKDIERQNRQIDSILNSM